MVSYNIGKKGKKMRVAVTGSSGLVGSRLCALLSLEGHEVVRFVRNKPMEDAANLVWWTPAEGVKTPENLEKTDAVIHLAGESVGRFRWSAALKKEIWDSRIEGTNRLVECFGRLSRPPKSFVSASAIGFYGNRGDEVLTENSVQGGGFLSELSAAWENSAQKAASIGIRVVTPRIGMVLAREGGALAKMLPAFKMGLGGRIGSGKQWVSWVTLEDLANLLVFLVKTNEITGPVNAVAPGHCTNASFTCSLARTLHRPALFPVPSAMVSAIFGEMGKELLLSSQRVSPQLIVDMGFKFKHSDLENALPFVLH